MCTEFQAEQIAKGQKPVDVNCLQLLPTQLKEKMKTLTLFYFLMAL